MDEKQNDMIAALIDFLSKRQKEKNDFRNKSNCSAESRKNLTR